MRGRFFDASGVFRTSEFDVSPNEPDGHDRTLAESAQHTIAYWAKDAAFAAWTEHDAEAAVTDHIWYSAFDSGFASMITSTPICTKGDVNGDSVVDFNDVGPFIDFLLTERVLCDAYSLMRCAVDTNNDGETNGLDVACISAILTDGDLSHCFQPLVADCGFSPGFTEEEGGGESMMAGGGGGEGGGEDSGMPDGGYVDPLASLSEEEIETRWNAVIDFLESHPRENYPEMTDEEHGDMCQEAFMEIMYEGIDLD